MSQRKQPPDAPPAGATQSDDEDVKRALERDLDELGFEGSAPEDLRDRDERDHRDGDDTTASPEVTPASRR